MLPPRRRASRSPSRTHTNQPGNRGETMATEVEALRGELSKMSDRAAENGPKTGTTASLRTGANGSIESVLVRFGKPVSKEHGDDIVASLEAWGDDIHGGSTGEPEEV